MTSNQGVSINHSLIMISKWLIQTRVSRGVTSQWRIMISKPLFRTRQARIQPGRAPGAGFARRATAGLPRFWPPARWTASALPH